MAEYSEYFVNNGIETLIIRPDYYIFGATASYKELPSLVDELSKQMHITKSSTALRLT